MPRTTTNLLAAALLAAVTAAGAAGCSSSSPAPSTATSGPTSAPTSNVGLSGAQLQSAFKSAAAGASSVHVVGAFTQNGSPYTLDLNLNRNGTTSGSISQAGAAIPVRVVNGVTYIQLTPEFLKLQAQSDPSITAAVISLMQNKWISSQSSIGQDFASSLGGLTDYNSFISTLLNGGTSGSASGSASASSSPPVSLSDLTADGTAQYNGQTVAVYKSSDGSVAYFAATGPALPERVTAKGSEPGTITFTWNQPVTVTAPQPSEIFST